jgi:hypothetical protein
MGAGLREELSCDLVHEGGRTHCGTHRGGRVSHHQGKLR